MTAPVFFAARATMSAGARVVLDGAEGRHAAGSRRLGVGETVLLTDGAGLAATASVASAAPDHLVLDIRELHQHQSPALRLTVVQALAKGDRGELAVQTLTEVGVDRIVPWAAARSVTRWRDERGARAWQGWQSTAREAAKQSRRFWWPQIDPLAGTNEISVLLASATLAVVLDEQSPTPLTELVVPSAGEVALVVGPEGGVAADEMAAFTAAGAKAVRLGPTVLRTSTAGTVAAALVLSRSERWQ